MNPRDHKIVDGQVLLRCSKCFTYKVPADFNKCRSMRDGRASKCRICARLLGRIRNPPKVRGRTAGELLTSEAVTERAYPDLAAERERRIENHHRRVAMEGGWEASRNMYSNGKPIMSPVNRTHKEGEAQQ